MFKKCVLIPARGGSKGIPRKNLFPLLGNPLIYYAIKAAIDSNLGDVWVSTDDQDIKEYSISLGAHVIDRPKILSGDLSTDFEVFNHFLKTCKENYDYVVHVRATFPKISSKIIREAADIFEENFKSIDSLRSVISARENPYKMWHISESNTLESVIVGNELHSAPRQLVKKIYKQNACIDIVKVDTILTKGSMVGERCIPMIMEDGFDFDIDTVRDILERKW